MNKYSFLLIAVFCFMMSCGSPDESSSSIGAKYELQIVDSVQVDLFASGLNIADVSDETGQILAFQTNPPIAYLLSPKAEILKIMDRPAGDPKAVGDYLLSGEFYEDGIALMGRTQVKTYDMDFNLRKSTGVYLNHSGMIWMGFNHLFEFEGDDHNKLLAYMGPETDVGAHMPEFYRKFKVATVVDPYLVGKENLTPENLNKGVFQPIGELNEDSRYLSSERTFFFMKPLIDVKERSLYYAFRDDTTMFKVSLPDGKLLEKTRIPFDEFIVFEGYTMGLAAVAEQRQPQDRGGRIEKLYKVGDFELVVYHSGMKLSDVQALGTSSPDFRDKVSKADPLKHLILRNGVRMNQELSLPSKISHFDMADNDGFIWAHQDLKQLEEEPDLITFYKLKIVEVK